MAYIIGLLTDGWTKWYWEHRYAKAGVRTHEVLELYHRLFGVRQEHQGLGGPELYTRWGDIWLWGCTKRRNTDSEASRQKQVEANCGLDELEVHLECNDVRGRSKYRWLGKQHHQWKTPTTTQPHNAWRISHTQNQWSRRWRYGC